MSRAIPARYPWSDFFFFRSTTASLRAASQVLRTRGVSDRPPIPHRDRWEERLESGAGGTYFARVAGFMRSRGVGFVRGGPSAACARKAPRALLSSRGEEWIFTPVSRSRSAAVAPGLVETVFGRAVRHEAGRFTPLGAGCPMAAPRRDLHRAVTRNNTARGGADVPDRIEVSVESSSQDARPPGVTFSGSICVYPHSRTRFHSSPRAPRSNSVSIAARNSLEAFALAGIGAPERERVGRVLWNPPEAPTGIRGDRLAGALWELSSGSENDVRATGPHPERPYGRPPPERR